MRRRQGATLASPSASGPWPILGTLVLKPSHLDRPPGQIKPNKSVQHLYEGTRCSMQQLLPHERVSHGYHPNLPAYTFLSSSLAPDEMAVSNTSVATTTSV